MKACKQSQDLAIFKFSGGNIERERNSTSLAMRQKANGWRLRHK